MPITVRVSAGLWARRRTVRSIVSRLAGTIFRRAKLSADLPPTARPR